LVQQLAELTAENVQLHDTVCHYEQLDADRVEQEMISIIRESGKGVFSGETTESGSGLDKEGTSEEEEESSKEEDIGEEDIGEEEEESRESLVSEEIANSQENLYRQISNKVQKGFR